MSMSDFPMTSACDLGDGWVVAADSELCWGLYGAAGLLLRHQEAGDTHFLIAERSAHVHHPGTWGIPGGALHRGESPEDGARREAEEEFAPVPDYEVVEVIVEDFGGWSYSTVVADAAGTASHPSSSLPAVEPVTYEHTRCRWATVAEMAHLQLHPGFARLLPRLR